MAFCDCQPPDTDHCMIRSTLVIVFVEGSGHMTMAVVATKIRK